MNTMTELSLKDITLKVVMLIALITGQRAQTMHLLDIRNRSVSELAHTYRIDVVKHTRPGKHQMEFELAAYPEDRSLCVVTLSWRV